MSLAPRLRGVDQEGTWVTFDGPQADVLRADREVVTIPTIVSRDYRGVVRGMGSARRQLAGRRYDAVVSTGSAIALSYLPVARAKRVPAHYIETATRSHGPSASAKILQR